MKQQILLHIPKPCHEDWNAMTPTQQGRHCTSCSKEVTDFSIMTDVEILKHLTKASSNACGRFTNDQLLRPLQPTKIEKKKGWQWLMATVASLFVITNKAAAQYKTIGKPAVQRNLPKQLIEQPIILGSIARVTPKILKTADIKKVTLTDAVKGQVQIAAQLIYKIKGQVADEAGTPLQDVAVSIGNYNGTNTQADGSFGLVQKTKQDSVHIKFAHLGFEEKIVTLALDNKELELHVQLKQKVQKLDDIVVTSGLTVGRLTGTVGGYYTTRCYIKITKIDTVKTAIRKAFKVETFKVYPNPALKGSTINIIITEVGDYSVQLLNNQSQLQHIETFTSNSKKQNFTMQLPATLSTGMYYVRLINEQTKKQYVEKIMMQ